MGVDAAALAGGALGGAVVQSVLGPLFGQRHERRELRAKVLRKIAEIENARWVPAEKAVFLNAAHELRSLVLVAGMNRKPVEFYVVVAAAAREKSELSLELAGGDVEFGGGIDGSLADLVRDAATLVTDCAWHPYLQRPLLPIRLRGLEKKKTEVTKDLNETHERILWDQGLPAVVLAGRPRTASG
ncbi:MAG: hypothetical protein ACTHLH_11160 [Solirubrobacterales bacterium]